MFDLDESDEENEQSNQDEEEEKVKKEDDATQANFFRSVKNSLEMASAISSLIGGKKNDKHSDLSPAARTKKSENLFKKSLLKDKI